MDRRRYQELRRLISVASDLPAAEREEFLSRECAADSSLRRWVEQLLEDESRTQDVFERLIGTPAVPTSSYAPGDIIESRYRIDSYLAGGGMGQVYRALDLDLEVPIALKTVHPEIASDPQFLRRFKQEVLLARSVTHPNVCRIFDFGLDREREVSYLTMEFLSGETLESRIRSQGPMAAEEALQLARQMAKALDAAHGAGVVHRDFKSANVMLVAGAGADRVVITDFGLALEINRLGDLDRGPDGDVPRTLEGTPAYMSPEQVKGEPVGPLADLYALGVVLFEMSTGQLPFRAATPLETAFSHVDSEPVPPSTLAKVEASWERTILKLLSKEPGERFATAEDAVRALEGCAKERVVVLHSLPAERDGFVGRVEELRTIVSCLEKDDPVRLLTLRGPGGTGKTRLAQRYGWDSLERWPGGVWSCDLAEATTVNELALALAGALDVQLGDADPIKQLGRALATRGRCLVILDHFERMAEHADATLGRWLEQATDARFLVTSRARLSLAGGVEEEIEPLDPVTDGVELLETRAQGHQPGFRVGPGNRRSVEEIVTRLEGLPLAIELAASRLRVLSVEQLRERLDNRFRILADGSGGRQGTLAATLDWSWDLLRPWERTALVQTTIFQGGFTLEAAEAVLNLPSRVDAPAVLDGLQSLVDRSWLRARVALGCVRFQMYGTIHDYLTTKLRDDPGLVGSWESVVGSWCAHFAEMGTVASLGELNQPGGVEKRAALNLELDNLLAVCRRSIEVRDESTSTSSYAAVHAVLELRGPFTVSIQLGLEVLETVKDLGLRSRVLMTLANAERMAGQIEDAAELYAEALTVARTLGDRRLEGVTLGSLGSIHRAKGCPEEAVTHFELALEVHRDVGNRRGEAIELGNLANLHFRQARPEAALQAYLGALAIYRELGNRVGEGVQLGNVANLHFEEGRLEEAQEHYEAALTIHREVGNRRVEGHVLGNLGSLHHDLGRRREAREHYEAALAIHHEVGNRRSVGHVLGDLGILHFERGRMPEAREHYDAALEIHREVGNRHTEGVLLGHVAVLHHALGQPEEMRRCFHEGITILRKLKDPHELGHILCLLGECEVKLGNRDASREVCEEVQAIAGRLDPSPTSRLARSIDRFRRLLGDTLA